MSNSHAYFAAERCLQDLQPDKPGWLLHAERSAANACRQEQQQAASSSGLGPIGCAREKDIRALVCSGGGGFANPDLHVFRDSSEVNSSGPIMRPGERVDTVVQETPSEASARIGKEQLLVSRRGSRNADRIRIHACRRCALSYRRR